MTSMTGEDPHPEVTEISDYSEGLLPPTRSAEIRSHIDGCSLCADVLGSLEEIRGLLGTLPEERMPADIAGRIDAALAAEALLDTTLPHVPRETSPERPETGATSGTDSGSGSGDDYSHVPRETSSAPTGHPSGSTGPGRTGSTRSGHGGRRRRGLLATAYATAALVLGGVIYGVVSTGSASNTSLDSGKRDTSVSAPDVAASVRELLGQQSTTFGSQDTAPGADRGNTPMLQKTPHTDVAPAQPAPVPSCVLKATHRTQPPIAAGREVFRGTEAYLVVLPHPADTSQVDAFVVNASCTSTTPGAVLFQATYPR
jgi:anti-sigma factor RsiW